MATGQYLSLVDLARRTDPDGDAADIAEMLSQANEIYDDLIWKEGNTNTGHVYTMRTSIPKGFFRFIGQGVPGSKSTTAQGQMTCGDLEMNSTIDLKLIEMARDQNQFRYEEDNAILEGASQTIAGQFFYGNGVSNPASFTGIANYYNTLETATSANAVNVFDGGGRASNNASIWLIGWSPRSIYGAFPRGMKAGVELTPLDEQVLAYDNFGNPYRAKITWFRQMALGRAHPEPGCDECGCRRTGRPERCGYFRDPVQGCAAAAEDGAWRKRDYRDRCPEREGHDGKAGNLHEQAIARFRRHTGYQG